MYSIELILIMNSVLTNTLSRVCLNIANHVLVTMYYMYTFYPYPCKKDDSNYFTICLIFKKYKVI